MDVEMVLADSMNMSKDGKSWNIKLKSGVKFHDGTIFNAEVVKLNLDRLYHFNPAKKEYDSNYKNIGEFGEIVDLIVFLIVAILMIVRIKIEIGRAHV